MAGNIINNFVLCKSPNFMDVLEYPFIFWLALAHQVVDTTNKRD